MRRVLAILVAIGLTSASLGCVHGICDCNDPGGCGCGGGGGWVQPPFYPAGVPAPLPAVAAKAPTPEPIPVAPRADK